MIGKTICGLLCFVATANVCQAQMGNIDTKHVSEDSFCVVRIDVERLIGHLKEAKGDFAAMAKMMKEESQLDPYTIKRITLQFGASDVDQGEPSFAVTFELSKKFPKETFFEEFGGLDSYTETTINGKKYYKPATDHEPHIYYESDLKFTMATPGAIEAVLNAGGGMGAMSSKLKSAPPESEIIAVFNRTEKFQESITDMTRGFSGLPIPFKLDDLIDQCESGIGYIDLKSGNPVRIRLSMVNKDSSQAFKKSLDALVEMGKVALPAARAELKKQVKDLENAEGFGAMQRDMAKVGLQSLDTGEKMLNGLKIDSESKLLTINVKKMGGMTELADMVVTAMQMTFMGFSGGIEDGPGPALKEEAIRGGKALEIDRER